MTAASTLALVIQVDKYDVIILLAHESCQALAQSPHSYLWGHLRTQTCSLDDRRGTFYATSSSICSFWQMISWTASGDPVYTVPRVWTLCLLCEFHDENTFALLIYDAGWLEVHSHRQCGCAKSLTREVLLHRLFLQVRIGSSYVSIKWEILTNFSACRLFTAFQWPSWPSLWYSMVRIQFFLSHTFTLMNKIACEALIINILYKNWRAFRQVKTKNVVSLSVLLRFIGFSMYRLVVTMYVSITLPI